MPPSKIFLTGGTGYAGSAILHYLLTSPSFPTSSIQITALVRRDAQATRLKSLYPGINTVLRSMDDSALLTTEASEVDIVLQAANVDHPTANDALLAGLVKRKQAEPEAKLAYIVLSGAGNLIDLGPSYVAGARDEKVWSDIFDEDELFDLPHDRLHVAIERRIVAEGDKHGIQTVILAPPVILSDGYGEGKKDSYYADIVKAIAEFGQGFYMGNGENRKSWIGTYDLAAVTGVIVEHIVTGTGKVGSGRKGYFGMEAGEFMDLQMMRVLAEEIKKKGLLKNDDCVEMGPEKAEQLHPMAKVLFGMNMRSRGDRVRSELGWTPRQREWERLARYAVQNYLDMQKISS
jgi:nucleoside-diphosphate-sugar epimerase